MRTSNCRQYWQNHAGFTRLHNSYLFRCESCLYPESHPNKHLSRCSNHLLSKCKHKHCLVSHWRGWYLFACSRNWHRVKVRHTVAGLIVQSLSTYHICHFLSFLLREDFYFNICVVELSWLRRAALLQSNKCNFVHRKLSYNRLA